MHNMKKLLIAIMAFLMLLTAAGCKEKEPENPYPDRDVTYSTDIPKLDEDSVQIHYGRDDNKYANWTLWLWDPEGTDDGLEDDFNYQDDYGVVASYPLSKFGTLSGGRLGIIVKTKGAWNKDGTDSDRFIVFNNYQKDANGVYHVYLYGGDEHLYTSAERIVSDGITSAAFTDGTTIVAYCSNPVETYKVYEGNDVILEGSGAGRSALSIKLDKTGDFTKEYKLEVLFRATGSTVSAPIDTSALYTEGDFDDLYYYDGQLGAIYSKDSTTFRVWSPVSSKIELNLYYSGTPASLDATIGNDAHETVAMTKGDKGVFETVVEGDLDGSYYTYTVYNDAYPEGKEIVDPYAKSAGISGLRGMVVNFAKTDPEGWNKVSYLDYDRKELVVWETHVADVTSSDTWTGTEANRRRYLGVVESGTTYSEGAITVTTGFDHIKELGVNAVQLQPIFDQDNDERSYTFNWGYNPLNYNVLEGMYSSDPYDGYARIKEFKTLVMEMYNAGIEVIMDVVYNHVSNAEKSNFEVLMPGYFFRKNTDGSYSNGSGCGNEFASENSMARKFIIDSVCFWLDEYKLSGFRFDLMGLHDIETMNEVTQQAQLINGNVVIYGEPWTGGTTPLASDLQAKQANANRFIGYGQFNDQMRDALIKGGLSAANELGWVTGTSIAQTDIEKISKGINGSTYNAAYEIADPNKTVNYVTCHDNYTLYDRIKAAGITDEDTVRKMAMLANSVVLTSKGTTFMLAGEEFLRTKQGNSNSYNATDEINKLDYSLKITNYDLFENYKKLIEFKKSTTVLHSADNETIKVESLDGGAVLKYEIFSDEFSYIVIHANGLGGTTAIDLSEYTVLLDTLGLYNGTELTTLVPEPYQSLIVYR